MKRIPYVFPNKQILIDYIAMSLPTLTSIKINQALYFMWSYYAASYGNEPNQNYPGYLFPPHFKALNAGAIDFELFNQYRTKPEYFNELNNCYFNLSQSDSAVTSTAEWLNVEDMLLNILSQVSKINDYNLVMRAKQDSAWLIAQKNYDKWMLPSHIKETYSKLIKQQEQFEKNA